MDWLNLMMNAVIIDQDGDYAGHVRGFEINGHRLAIKAILLDEDGSDDDGGQKLDIPEVGNVVEFKPDMKLDRREDTGTNG